MIRYEIVISIAYQDQYSTRNFYLPSFYHWRRGFPLNSRQKEEN